VQEQLLESKASSFLYAEYDMRNGRAGYAPVANPSLLLFLLNDVRVNIRMEVGDKILEKEILRLA
jgi:hypothetical protein